MAIEPDVVANLNDWVRAVQAERYFRSDNLGKTVRSFVSLPFGLPDIQPGAVKRSIWVVNLHSSAPGLLGEEEVRLFAPLDGSLQDTFVIALDGTEQR